MKKILPVLYTIVLCVCLCSCGGSNISGDTVTYTNTAGSVSIDLPGTWIANEDAYRQDLDVTTENGTANVQIQCLAKGQIDYIANDLESYTDYAMTNTLGEILSNAETTDAKISVPEFIKASKSQNFTLKNGDDTVKGFFITMESSKCYYTCVVMAVGEVYDSNDKILTESILTIKELTKIPVDETSKDNNDN